MNLNVFLDKFSKKQWWAIGVSAAIAMMLVLFLSGIVPGLIKHKPQPITLKFLGVEDARIWRPIIGLYQKEHPFTTIKYQQVDRTDYEQRLLNQLAAGSGPDIFMFHNTWLPKHFDKITPASADQFSADRFALLFPTVAIQDFAPDNVVFASPLYIDTLALYYNKDLLDKNGIALLPKTWLQFQDTVKKLPWPAVAIGGSTASVSQAVDILNLLFLQSGTPMINQQFSRATFASQGQIALNFYLSFSDPHNEFYAWNDQQPLDINLFAEGKLPFLFHYKKIEKRLRQINPILNFAAASVPQPTSQKGHVAYADYFGLTVSNKTPFSQEAWDFIKFVTTDEKISRLYLAAAGQSPALRSLIQEEIKQRPASPFAKQALIARNWPQVNSRLIKQIFNQALRRSLTKQTSPAQALKEAEQQITNLIRKR